MICLSTQIITTKETARMDTGFIDLEILISRIRHAPSKKYFLDSVKAYKAGALRASLTSAWVALVYDLIAKYRELSAHGDLAATAFVQLWDTANASDDIKKLLQLEGEIVEHATRTTQVINSIAQKHLFRLREDRHLCAHPAFSAEAELFEPSPELVRLHLVNVVDLVLSREPRQGKAIFDVFNVDVQSPGFPAEHSHILDYVEQRYLERVRTTNIHNFGTVLAKSLLKGVPLEWETHQSKIISSLVALQDRAISTWPDVSTTIIRLIDNIEPEHRPRAIAFLASFPIFWESLQASTQTALQETAANLDPGTLSDYRILVGVRLPQFRTALLNVIADLDARSLIDAVAQRPIPELWTRGIAIYGNSGGFRGSEDNFRRLILPFAGRLDSSQVGQLLDAVMENSQNWDAGETPSLLLGVLRNVLAENHPSADSKNRFFLRCQDIYRTQDYEPVLDILRSNGWVEPAIEPSE